MANESICFLTPNAFIHWFFFLVITQTTCLLRIFLLFFVQFAAFRLCMYVCVFQNKVEGLRESLSCVPCETVAAQLEALVEQTEDFTDSAYTSHEQRESILQLCHTTRQETKQLISTWSHAVRHAIIPTHTYTCVHMQNNQPAPVS